MEGPRNSYDEVPNSLQNVTACGETVLRGVIKVKGATLVGPNPM